MANIERGEVDLVVERDGVDRIYTLKMTTSAAIAVEQRTKKKVGELLMDSALIGVESQRDLLFVLLQKHHADEFKNLAAVTALMDDIPRPAVVIDAFEQLFSANQEKKTENPPTAQGGNGTGENSTSTPEASA